MFWAWTQLEALQNRLLIESKIKDGAENLLQVFQLGAEKEGLRSQIIAELAAANREIESLERRISDLQRSINGKVYPLPTRAHHTPNPLHDLQAVLRPCRT